MPAHLNDLPFFNNSISQTEEKSTLSNEKVSDNIRKSRKISAEQEEETVDSNEKIRYNRNKVTRYISYDKVGNENIRHIKTELKKLYGENDGIANGVAISNGNEVYIVDSGRDNGKITLGVRKIITITDSNLRAEFIRRENNDALSKGYIDNELSSKLKSGYDINRRSNRRQEYRTELQTDSRESADNQGRVFDENANNRGLTSKVQKSRSITVEQDAEYMAAVEANDVKT